MEVAHRVHGALSDLHAAIDNGLEYIFRKLEYSNVSVIFDRYLEYSTKSATRTSRAVQQGSKRHKLTSSTPLPAKPLL